MVDWSACPEVESVPDRVSGNWVFRGTRLPVYSLFESLAVGATIHDFMEWFDGVDETDVKAVLEFVAQDLRNRVPELLAIPKGSDGFELPERTRDHADRDRKELDIEEMISRVTPENRHEEWDLGPPQGKEIW